MNDGWREQPSTRKNKLKQTELQTKSFQIQEAAGGERAGAEADERPERRLRAPERAHPQSGQRQEAQQVRDAPDGADVHWIAQGTAGPGRSGLERRRSPPLLLLLNTARQYSYRLPDDEFGSAGL